MIFRRNDRLYIRERGAELGPGSRQKERKKSGRARKRDVPTWKRTKPLVIPDFTGIKELITRLRHTHD